MPQKRRGRPGITIICTVRNEAGSVGELVSSVLSGERKPDAFIIVDGGSTDGTPAILRRRFGRRVRVIVAPGANIAAGRNAAVRAAGTEWIASIDGGCVARPGWLSALERGFAGADVVSGAYVPLARSAFERAQGRIVCKDPESLGEGFLPSSRSVAFRKSAWEKAGGYPEGTYTAEDTLFDINLRKTGARFSFARDAIVEWRMRPDIRSFERQFYNYGLGDGRTGLVLGMPGNLLLVLAFKAAVWGLLLSMSANPLLLFLAAPFALLVLAESAYHALRDPAHFHDYFVLVLAKRAGYSLGASIGLFRGLSPW